MATQAQAVILAAGKGTRMRSAHPKVLHPILGLPIVEYVVRAVEEAGADPLTLVVGHQAAEVEAAFATRRVSFVRQDPPLGTGHALQAARDAFSGRPDRPLLVVNGDLPLLTGRSLSSLLAGHARSGAVCSLLTVHLPDGASYGRIVRDASGAVRQIVEARDASPEERRIGEVNAGVYVFSVPALLAVLDKIESRNAQGEYYLTDLVGHLSERHGTVHAQMAEDPDEALGVNSLEELADLAARMRRRILRDLMASGVRVEEPETCSVGPDVQVEADAALRAFTIIEGKTRIARGAVVGPFARLSSVVVGPDAQVLDHTVLRDCVLEGGSSVGPFAHLRPESRVGAGAKVGNFVELKKTHLGDGSKAQHLSYLGDATIGAGVNIGAGTITCNYDGVKKHPTQIGDGAFVGSDSTLVAPVTIGEGAYVGAGSTITEDVPAGALALGRARQVVKPGWAQKRTKKLVEKG